MQVFDLQKMQALPYEQREKNVLYGCREFKARIIELPPGGTMPECTMASHVVFYVISGSALVSVNGEKRQIGAGECLITEPALLSMETGDGVRIMGIQITKQTIDAT